MQRRQFLKRTAATALVGATGSLSAVAAPPCQSPNRPSTLPAGTIDANVYLARWPLRRLPADETPNLVQMLRSRGVTQAWAGSFEGLLHNDMTAVNARLVEQCQREGEGMLVPFGTINPKLPGWEKDLRQCLEEYRMPGIRLHPNYHQYDLSDPALERLMQMANERRLVVQLAAWMEDQDDQHPLTPVAPIDLTPLPGLMAQWPDLRLVVLNGLSSDQASTSAAELAKAKNVYWDIARVPSAEAVRQWVQQTGIDRLLFGSYSPNSNEGAAFAKLAESVFEEGQLDAICHGNAHRLVGG